MRGRKFRWESKRVVVTGAGSGIGRGLAVRLAAKGTRLALSDIQPEGLAETAEQARSAGAAQVLEYALDVADRPAVRAHVTSVLEDLQGVDAVINNAGVALAAEATEQSLADIDWLMNINLRGVMDLSQLFLPHLIASGDGCLVNLSSVFGLIGIPGQSAYNAAKFGVRGYTEALAMEMQLKDHPVSVHCVHPGGVATNIVRDSRVVGRDRGDLAEKFAKTAKTSPDTAAGQIIRGVERGTRRILVGADAHIIHFMANALGSGYQRLIPPMIKRWVGDV
ncbi:MAG: short-subunit dehydrogenase [Myxococcota bacterium]|jgi:short-subunit dehydrogenase